jgi:vacuolar-type H+-ATPase subunit E/Vma4
MSLQEIREEVISAARKEAESIIQRALAEKERKIAQAKRSEEERLKDTLAREIAALETQLSNELANLRQEVKISILAAKNETVERVLSLSLQMLENLDEKELREVLINSLKSLPPEVSGEVLLSPKDAARFGPALVEEANRSRTQGRFSGPTADPAVSSGLRVKNPGYDIDLTFATRIAEMKAEIIPLIAEKIFATLQGK